MFDVPVRRMDAKGLIKELSFVTDQFNLKGFVQVKNENVRLKPQRK